MRANSISFTLVTAMLLVGAHTSTAGPVLLASFPDSGSVAASPNPGGAVEIVLRHQSVLDGFRVHELGRGVLWNDGAAGTLDFALASAPDFAAFVDGFTNAVDDYVTVLIEWPDVGGGGSIDPESDLGLGSPDLYGNELEFVRLVVHDLRITPWLDGFAADVDLTYEFYGTPIPEPAALMLLALGSLAVLRRRR